MSIHELAEKSGVSVRTIHYYIAEGLLPPPGGSGPTRVYGSEHYLRLRLIRLLQEEHVPLRDIKLRLSGLSVAEMERFVSRAARHRQEREETLSDPRLFLSETLTSPSRRRSAALMRKVISVPRAERTEGVWRRLTLAPGIELHYQSDDAALISLVQDIAQYVARRGTSGKRHEKREGP